VGEKYDDHDHDHDCVEMNLKGENFSSGGCKGSSSMLSKKPRQKGLLDVFFSPILQILSKLERS